MCLFSTKASLFKLIYPDGYGIIGKLFNQGKMITSN